MKLRHLFSRRQGEEAITCQQAVALIASYLDDALDPAERARLESHLAGCGHCGEHLAQIRATIAVTAKSDAGDLGPDARSALTDLFRTWQKPT